MTVGIIGSGSFAIALAKLLVANHVPIHWWIRCPERLDFFNQYAYHKEYLSKVKFSPDELNFIQTSDNISTVFDTTDTLLIVLPSVFLVDSLAPLAEKDWSEKKIISATKGLTTSSYILINVYLKQAFDVHTSNYVAITGPAHSEEIADSRLTYLTFSAQNSDLSKRISSYFASPNVKTRTSVHLQASQYAGVLKNIYAIASGIAFGLNFKDNFQGALVANAAREMFKLLKYMCKDELFNDNDFLSSNYLGDLLVTCYSSYSRNRKFGQLLTTGLSPEQIVQQMNMVAEGYYSLQALHQRLTDRELADFPIAHALCEVIHAKANIKTTFNILISKMI